MDLNSIKLKTDEIIQLYNPDGLVPFPFEDMAKQLGNVELILPEKMQAHISGAIIYQESDNKFAIIINKTKPAVRQYFTTAHEFGHLFLHGDWLKENTRNGFIDYEENLDGDGMLLRPDAPPIDGDLIKKEREANNFAAELIMPEAKVRELWQLTHDIKVFANAFRVSQSAMAIRLERLNLVS